MITIYALHGINDSGEAEGSVYRARREELPFGGWTSQGYNIERVEELTVTLEHAEALGVTP